MQSESREKPEHSDTYRASTSEPGLRCTANGGEGGGRGRGGGVSSITAAGTDGEQLLWMEMCFDDGDVLQCSLHLQLCCHCYALASCPEQQEECSLLLVTALFIRAAPQDPLNISRQLKYFTAHLM